MLVDIARHLSKNLFLFFMVCMLWLVLFGLYFTVKHKIVEENQVIVGEILDIEKKMYNVFAQKSLLATSTDISMALTKMVSENNLSTLRGGEWSMDYYEIFNELNTHRTQYRISQMKTHYGPWNGVNLDKNATLEGNKLFQSIVNVEFNSFLDIDAIMFIMKFVTLIPGYLDIINLKIERQATITDEYLESLKTDPKGIIHVVITIAWYVNNNEMQQINTWPLH